MSEQETILVDGMFFNRPHENSPDFVKGHVGIKVDEMIAFLQKHKKADGWVNIDFLKSQKENLYFKLNTWTPPEKKEESATNYATQSPEYPGEDINPADQPF